MSKHKLLTERNPTPEWAACLHRDTLEPFTDLSFSVWEHLLLLFLRSFIHAFPSMFNDALLCCVGRVSCFDWWGDLCLCRSHRAVRSSEEGTSLNSSCMNRSLSSREVNLSPLQHVTAHRFVFKTSHVLSQHCFYVIAIICDTTSLQYMSGGTLCEHDVV